MKMKYIVPAVSILIILIGDVLSIIVLTQKS